VKGESKSLKMKRRTNRGAYQNRKLGRIYRYVLMTETVHIWAYERGSDRKIIYGPMKEVTGRLYMGLLERK
jgi:hypothetical protein